MVLVNLAPGQIGGTAAVQIDVISLAVVFHGIRGVFVQLAARKVVIVAVCTTAKDVAACAAYQLVFADAAIKRVVAGITIKRVVIISPFNRRNCAAARMAVVVAPEDVVPFATMQGVAAVLTDDEVVPIAAVEEILGATAGGAVLFLVLMLERGINLIVALFAQNLDAPADEFCGQTGGILVALVLPLAFRIKRMLPGRVTGQGFQKIRVNKGDAAGQIFHNIRIFICQTMEHPLHLYIGAHHAVAEDNIVAGTADNRVTAFAALQEILVDAAVKTVITFAAQHPVALFRDDNIALLQMARLHIGIKHIIAGHAVNEVPAAAADDGVAVFGFLLRITPLVFWQDKRAAVQNIGIIAAINPVAIEAAEDRIIARTGVRNQCKAFFIFRF